MSSDIIFEFRSSAFDDDTFSVLDFTGFESISRLYQFEINLVSESGEIDIEKVANHDATFVMGGAKFHGIIQSIKYLNMIRGIYYYEAVLVPRLWLLTLQERNEIHTGETKDNVTVRHLLEQSFKQKDIFSGGLSSESDYRLPSYSDSLDFEWSMICQYQESTFDLISRWMERLGVYYYFDQDETSGKERLIVSSRFNEQKDIDIPIPFRQMDQLSTKGQNESIRAFICDRKRLPRKVILTDYNYMDAGKPIRVESEVSETGIGEKQFYGENLVDARAGSGLEQAQQMANIRAEEISCRGTLFHGESSSSQIRSGFYFKLSNHYHDEFNDKRYLVTQIKHEGSQKDSVLSTAHREHDEHVRSPFYINTFEAISEGVQFRPERFTEKPRITGSMSATIFGEEEAEHAEPDEFGRYRVLLPFWNDEKEGKKTCRIRLLTPSSGSNGQGVAFPLRKGTDVILSFIDGDPDRPIITGAVPNSINEAVVTDKNATVSRISTEGGNEIKLEDKDEGQFVSVSAPEEQSYLNLGKPHTECTTISGRLERAEKAETKAVEARKNSEANLATKQKELKNAEIRWSRADVAWSNAIREDGDKGPYGMLGRDKEWKEYKAAKEAKKLAQRALDNANADLGAKTAAETAAKDKLEKVKADEANAKPRAHVDMRSSAEVELGTDGNNRVRVREGGLRIDVGPEADKEGKEVIISKEGMKINVEENLWIEVSDMDTTAKEKVEFNVTGDEGEFVVSSKGEIKMDADKEIKINCKEDMIFKTPKKIELESEEGCHVNWGHHAHHIYTGTLIEETYGNILEMKGASVEDFHFGESFELFAGASQSIDLIEKLDICVGFKQEIDIAGILEIFVGLKLELALAGKIEAVFGNVVELHAAGKWHFSPLADGEVVPFKQKVKGLGAALMGLKVENSGFHSQ